MPADLPRPNDDVRMRGFAERVTVEAALEWVDAHAQRLGDEPADLDAAGGRVLAADVVSQVDVPGFDRAMMDGYAVRAADTQGASPYQGLPLTVLGESMPGQPFAGTVTSGTAVRIMTGAPLPEGADAVLPFEMTESPTASRDDENDSTRTIDEVAGVDPSSTSAASRVVIHGEVSPEKHVGRCGEDIQAGSTVLRAGRALRPQDVGVLSSIGVRQVLVVRRPRVSVIATGNELVAPGQRPAAHQVADANTPMLCALVRRDGGEPQAIGPVADDAEAILAAMQDAADVVLVSGGSSVGREDYVPTLLARHGELAIHGVAMRPSSPVGMGTLDGRPVFLLPGNPVSCLCAYDFYAGRAIRLLGGRSAAWPYRTARGVLIRKLVSVVGRVDYARVCVHDGRVEPVAVSGASVLSSTTRADGFVIVPGDSEGMAAGAEVEVYLYDTQ